MKLTVIIRDASPVRHLNEPCSYRRVTLELTREQMAALQLKHDDEAVNQCFLEPPEPR